MKSACGLQLDNVKKKIRFYSCFYSSKYSISQASDSSTAPVVLMHYVEPFARELKSQNRSHRRLKRAMAHCLMAHAWFTTFDSRNVNGIYLVRKEHHFEDGKLLYCFSNHVKSAMENSSHELLEAPKKCRPVSIDSGISSVADPDADAISTSGSSDFDATLPQVSCKL